MADNVMSMVRRELSRDPHLATRDLFQKAKDLDPSLKGLTLRQFHARYPLQVTKAARLAEAARTTQAPPERKTRRRRPAGTTEAQPLETVTITETPIEVDVQPQTTRRAGRAEANGKRTAASVPSVPDTPEAIREWVRAQLAADRAAKSSDLFEKAQVIFPSVRSLGLRSFHARYPLQIVREMGRSSRPASRPSAPARSAAAESRGRSQPKGAEPADGSTAPTVLDWVRNRLAEDRTLRSAALHEEAKAQFPEVRTLTVQQFHARYPLRVRREWTLRQGAGRRRRRRKDNVNREAIRSRLLKLIGRATEAEGTELVDLVAHLDKDIEAILADAGVQA